MNQKSMAAFLIGGIVVMGGSGALAVGLVSSPGSSGASRTAVGAQHEPLAGARNAAAMSPKSPAPTTVPPKAAVQAAPPATAPPATAPPATAPPATAPPATAPSATVPSATVPPVAAAPADTAPATSVIPPATSARPPTSAMLPPVTYTVKAGDTLSTIAAWFHKHGYGALYEANRAVIGSNPNLIFPGERITISSGVMTTGG